MRKFSLSPLKKFNFGCVGYRLWCELFSLVAASRGYSLIAVHELFIGVLSLVAEHGLSGAWASVVVAPDLQRIELVVVAYELSYPAACGIFPDEGLNLCLLHWRVDSLQWSH